MSTYNDRPVGLEARSQRIMLAPTTCCTGSTFSLTCTTLNTARDWPLESSVLPCDTPRRTSGWTGHMTHDTCTPSTLYYSSTLCAYECILLRFMYNYGKSTTILTVCANKTTHNNTHQYQPADLWGRVHVEQVQIHPERCFCAQSTWQRTQQRT